jgi:hypothetical protein
MWYAITPISVQIWIKDMSLKYTTMNEFIALTQALFRSNKWVSPIVWGLIKGVENSNRNKNPSWHSNNIPKKVKFVITVLLAL